MTVWLYTPLLYQFSLFYAPAHILNGMETGVLRRPSNAVNLSKLNYGMDAIFYGKTGPNGGAIKIVLSDEETSR